MCPRGCLRLLPSGPDDLIYRLKRPSDRCGGTLRLIAQRVPLEAVVVRAVAQIAFRLVEIRRPQTVCRRRQVIGCHDKSAPIDFADCIQLYHLHEALSLAYLVSAVFYFAQDRRVVEDVFLKFGCPLHNLYFVDQQIRGHDHALSPLL